MTPRRRRRPPPPRTGLRLPAYHARRLGPAHRTAPTTAPAGAARAPRRASKPPELQPGLSSPSGFHGNHNRPSPRADSVSIATSRADPPAPCRPAPRSSAASAPTERQRMQVLLERRHDFHARLAVARSSSFWRPSEATCARCSGVRASRSWATLISAPNRKSGGSRSSPATAINPPRLTR